MGYNIPTDLGALPDNVSTLLIRNSAARGLLIDGLTAARSGYLDNLSSGPITAINKPAAHTDSTATTPATFATILPSAVANTYGSYVTLIASAVAAVYRLSIQIALVDVATDTGKRYTFKLATGAGGSEVDIVKHVGYRYTSGTGIVVYEFELNTPIAAGARISMACACGSVTSGGMEAYFQAGE